MDAKTLAEWEARKAAKRDLWDTYPDGVDDGEPDTIDVQGVTVDLQGYALDDPKVVALENQR